MKRKTTLTSFAALVVSLVLLTTAQAQNQLRAVADTGIITIGPNQILRISGDGVDQDDVVTFRFRRIGYQTATEAPGITKYTVISNTITNPIMTTGMEGVAIVQGNLIGTDAVRVVVMSNRPNVRVNAALIDAATGNTQVLIALLLP